MNMFNLAENGSSSFKLSSRYLLKGLLVCFSRMKSRNQLLVIYIIFQFCMICSAQETKTHEVQSELPLLKVKTLVAPVTAARQWTWAIAKSSAGNWQYITTFFNYGYGKKTLDPEWIIIDLETGEQQTFSFPGYGNTRYQGMNNIQTANGRIFLGANDCRVHYYDPESNTIKSLGKIFPNDSQYRIFYSMVLGADNMVYLGTQSNNGKIAIVQIDPVNLKIRRFMDVAGVKRKENLTYAYYVAVDPPWVYIAAGKGRWRLLSLNTETGKGDVLADNCTFISFDTFPAGVFVKLNSKLTGKADEADRKASNIIISGKGKSTRMWCYDGKLSPAMDMEKSYPGKMMKERFPAFYSKKELKVKEIPPKVDITQPDKNGIIKITVSKTGDIKKFTAKTNNVQGIDIESLTTLPNGDLFGNCRQYRGFFRYNTETEKRTYFGKHGPSGPRYAHAGGLLYFTGYPTAGLYVYDPKHPWQTKDSVPRVPPRKYNPKFLDYLGISSGAHYSYFLIPANNGRLYFGGRLERGHTGSGVAYYDIKTKKIVGHHKNLNFIKPRGMVLLESLNRIVLAGKLQDDPNAKMKKPEEAQLVFFDLDLKEIERQSIRKGVLCTGHLYPLPDKQQFLGNIKDKETQIALYRYNVKDKKVELWKDLKVPVSQVIIKKSDNSYWVVQKDTLGKLNIDTLEITQVGKMKTVPTHLVWEKDRLYGAIDADLVEVDVSKLKR